MEPVGRPAARGRSRAPGSPHPQADSPSLWTAHLGHAQLPRGLLTLGTPSCLVDCSPWVQPSCLPDRAQAEPRNWAAHKLGCASRPGTSWAAQAGPRNWAAHRSAARGRFRGRAWGSGCTDRQEVVAGLGHRHGRAPLAAPVHRSGRATTSCPSVRRTRDHAPNRPTRLSPPGPMPGSSTDSGFESRQPTKKPSADQGPPADQGPARRPETVSRRRAGSRRKSRQPAASKGVGGIACGGGE
jgi:hypothetical protein